MNELIEIKLKNVLKAEAEYIMRSPEDIKAKLEKMDDIYNITKIIEHYDELKPILEKYLKEKAEKDKWEESR